MTDRIYADDRRLQDSAMLLRDYAHRIGGDGALLELPDDAECNRCSPATSITCPVRLGIRAGTLQIGRTQIAPDESACPLNVEGITISTEREPWPRWLWHRCDKVMAIPCWAMAIIRERHMELRKRMKKRSMAVKQIETMEKQAAVAEMNDKADERRHLQGGE